jgi:hypothetical protein
MPSRSSNRTQRRTGVKAQSSRQESGRKGGLSANRRPSSQARSTMGRKSAQSRGRV